MCTCDVRQLAELTSDVAASESLSDSESCEVAKNRQCSGVGSGLSVGPVV